MLRSTEKVFRIYRDTRFSPNKQPYKTHVAAAFLMRGGSTMGDTPGLYLFIDTTEAWIGGGIYMPDNKQLKLIRHAIANKPEEFLAAVTSKDSRKIWRIEGRKITADCLSASRRSSDGGVAQV